MIKSCNNRIVKYGKEISNFMKNKLKSYGDTINTNCQGKKIPKENTQYTCFSVILLDSVIKLGKTYYAQTFLEKWKYEIKIIKTKNLIINYSNLSSLDDNDSDDKYDDKSNDKNDDEFSAEKNDLKT